MEGKPFNLKDICRKPLYVSETTPAVKVMELFKKTGIHIALVVDEYGEILGLVTFDDILRSVFEDIEDAPEGKRKFWSGKTVRGSSPAVCPWTSSWITWKSGSLAKTMKQG